MDHNPIQFNSDELFGSTNSESSNGNGENPSEHADYRFNPTETGDHPRGPLQSLIDDNFLQYASYVIRDRAIPDIDDGLKPVQRRIMHSLYENDDGKFIKVANIVGYCMQYHPHGDASIADALVTLVNKRYLIEGQGNFGNVFTGDPAAASRYIECRLTELARKEIFNPELTRYIPSYDGRKKEPITLPSKLPLLLMLGTEGIAVGLSTRILPHNFNELIDAQIAILKKKPFSVLPDFQHGALMDVSDYDKGKGKVRLRAVIEEKDDSTLIIKEIPYGTTTDSIISSVEEATRKKKIKVRSIHDYTSEHIEIEIKLVAGEDTKKAIQALYAFTNCETSISSNLVLISKNRPVEMTVDEVLKYCTKHLLKLLERELNVEKNKLLDELHRKTLVQIFVENRIYKKIEECKTYPAVQKAVLDGVNEYRDLLRRDVTQKDVEMLLSIQVKRISQYDINKNRKDIGDIIDQLAQVDKHLSTLTPYTIRYLKRIQKTYGADYPRRTQITKFKTIEAKKLDARHMQICYDREKGYLGYDIEGEPVIECTQYDKLVLVWESGVYKVIQPPEKFFVDHDLLYCNKADRDREMLAVYTDGDIVHMKRFTFGGTILNRDYTCAPADNAKLLYFSDQCPETLYVKYAPSKRQKISQQEFHPKRIPVKSAKTKGIQMTVKKIQSISSTKPKRWDSKKSAPRGALMDFV